MNDIYYIHRTDLSFYCVSLYGSRTIAVPDPSWERPKTKVADPSWIRPKIQIVDPTWKATGKDGAQTPPAISIEDPNAVAPLIEADDMTAVHPLITVANPECSLPPAEDLIELTAEQYEQFSKAAARALEGQLLGFDAEGLPAVVEAPAPTAEELAKSARRKRDEALAVATARIAPLQDAVDLGEATDSEEQALLAWKRYRVSLNRIEQQAGYPAIIEWPASPAEVTA